MTILQAFVLGVLQGLTEFLPVSSSGHLVVVPWLLRWAAPGVTFDAVLHLATVVAIVLVFWRDLIRMVSGWFRFVFRRQPSVEGRLAWLLILSAFPAAILGYLLNDLFDALFGTPRLVAVFLMITAVILWTCELISRRTRSLERLTWRDALLMGLAQGIAIAPGISRSGATLSVGMLCGLRREEAARFSFLMAIPVIVGATVFKLTDAPLVADQAVLLGIGFGAALAAGYLVIRAFINYLRSHSLRPFAVYCAVLGVMTLVITFIRP
jgi:undecaprenyl-diphosphatase